MRRTAAITLALMGGGLATVGVAHDVGRHRAEAAARACEQARATQAPDADALCARAQALASSAGRSSGSGSSSSYGRSYFHSGRGDGGGSTVVTSAAPSRGGFGGSAAAHGGE